MKQILNIFIVIAVLLGAGYFMLRVDSIRTTDGVDNQATYINSDVGLEFNYREGPTGYIVDERIPVDLGTGLLRVIILARIEDVEKGIPESGEYPPAITIAIFENSKKESPRVWAENSEFNNFALKTSDATEAMVGGANAIRYMADGLYASEEVVIAHENTIYLVNGQFADENSDIRRDFEPLLNSLNFIPIISTPNPE